MFDSELDKDASSVEFRTARFSGDFGFGDRRRRIVVIA